MATKRPQNRCSQCGYTWYPRGKNISLRCPNCGHTGVKLVAGGAASVGALVLWAALSSGGKTPPSQPSPPPNAVVVAADISGASDLASDPASDVEQVNQYPAGDPLPQDEVDSTEGALPGTNSSTDSVGISEPVIEAPQPPKLKEYYSLVVGSDGKIQTLVVKAVDTDGARRVLRDFRGNPRIIEGPSETEEW